MLFKNSVRTSKRTPHFIIAKINWLTLFKEIIAVYTEDHAKPIHKNADDTYSYRSALKGYVCVITVTIVLLLRISALSDKIYEYVCLLFTFSCRS
jgi:hypothetical protein